MRITRTNEKEEPEDFGSIICSNRAEDRQWTSLYKKKRSKNDGGIREWMLRKENAMRK